MIELRNIEFFRSLLIHQRILNRINECHQLLSDNLVSFSAIAIVQESAQQRAYEAARTRDVLALRDDLTAIQQDESRILAILHLDPNLIQDAMSSMEQSLEESRRNSVPTETVEGELLDESLQVLQRQSGTPHLPEWFISIFDIEIDENSNLGSGSFGVVKTALWGQTPVAVKRASANLSRENFMAEVGIWSKLRHPNILPFYGASHTANPPFFVSAFMENGNLVKYLRNNPDANRGQLLHEVALGLEYLHARNFIHGDLKGYNVLVDQGGHALLADFGLSKLTTNSVSRSRARQDSNIQVGTLHFMAPEVMTQRIMTAAGDIYSYAMLMYEAFTNEVPFKNITTLNLYREVGQLHTRLSRPTSDSAIQRGLTDEMWNLLWECSSPDQSLRPIASTLASRTNTRRRNWPPPIIRPSPQTNDSRRHIPVTPPSSQGSMPPFSPPMLPRRSFSSVGDDWSETSSFSTLSYDSIKVVRISYNNRYIAIAGQPPSYPSSISDTRHTSMQPSVAMFDASNPIVPLWIRQYNISSSIRFSLDSSKLLCGMVDGAKILNVEDGSALGQILRMHKDSKGVGFLRTSHSTTEVVSVNDEGLVQFTDMDGHRTLSPIRIMAGTMNQLDEIRVTHATLTPDGSLIVAVTSTKALVLSETTTGRSSQLEQQPLGSEYTSVMFSPDGQYLATSTKARRQDYYSLAIWNTSTRQRIHNLTTSLTIVSIAFHPQAPVIATCSSTGHLAFWDINQGRKTSEIMRLPNVPARRGLHLIFAPSGPNSSMNLITFSPDGKSFVYHANS